MVAEPIAKPASGSTGSQFDVMRVLPSGISSGVREPDREDAQYMQFDFGPSDFGASALDTQYQPGQTHSGLVLGMCWDRNLEIRGRGRRGLWGRES
jgi:hypothetical protein